MSTLTAPENPDADDTVKAVFDDIRNSRGTDYINNIWRYLARDPALLKDTWSEIKSVMGSDTHIDSKTKEMIYIAVSVANACSYCVHSHTAAAKAKGMTDAEQTELMRVIALAAKTNHLVTAMQIPVDSTFDADQKK